MLYKFEAFFYSLAQVQDSANVINEREKNPIFKLYFESIQK